jgi:predicted DNA-binding transcriptional regulator YafY
MAYKHDYDKILTRLTIILSRLNDGEALSITELATEFNVSARTLQRDFNDRLISFPIYQDKKKWKMQEGFKLEKTTSIEDTVVLDIMEGLIDGSSGTFSTKAKKLLSKIKNEELNPIYAKLDIEDISDKLKEVQQLEKAIKTKHIVVCNYIMDKDTIKLSLNPLKIVNFEGFWYLIAMDRKNSILKKFYLKSIKNIKIKDESFQTEKRLEKLLENSRSIWFDDSIDPFKVTLHISSNISKYIERKPILKTQKIVKKYEDNSMDISIMITHEMEITPLVKYWLPHIHVLEPQSIKEQIEKDLRTYLD